MKWLQEIRSFGNLHSIAFWHSINRKRLRLLLSTHILYRSHSTSQFLVSIKISHTRNIALSVYNTNRVQLRLIAAKRRRTHLNAIIASVNYWAGLLDPQHINTAIFKMYYHFSKLKCVGSRGICVCIVSAPQKTKKNCHEMQCGHVRGCNSHWSVLALLSRPRNYIYTYNPDNAHRFAHCRLLQNREQEMHR